MSNKTDGVVTINTDIEEASGIKYNEHNNTLYVVSDQGYIFQMTPEGEIIHQGDFGEYNCEGITMLNKNVLLIAVEGVGENFILVVSALDFQIIKEIPIHRKKGWDTDRGVEGIVNVGGEIFLTNQSYEIAENVDTALYPSMIFNVQLGAGDDAVIGKQITVPYSDLAGLAYYEGNLYIISDDENLLIEFDLVNAEVLNLYELIGEDQEGITFDDAGNMYIAQDSGGVIKMDFEQFKEKYRKR